jgi:hypothetical protein
MFEAKLHAKAKIHQHVENAIQEPKKWNYYWGEDAFGMNLKNQFGTHKSGTPKNENQVATGLRFMMRIKSFECDWMARPNPKLNIELKYENKKE